LISLTSDPLLLGAVVDDRYELRRVLGRGAAAVVYAAEHLRVHRPVALKLSLHNAELNALLSVRLRREIDALSRVRHHAIIDALDAGEHEGLPYLVMELIEGRTLAGLIAARGRLAPEETLKVGIALAEGLDAVHAAGIVHRDVKPLNVLLTHAPWRQVHLCDFGIAKLRPSAAGAPPRLTEPGALIGTLEYMPLEALEGSEEADHRVDVYALGITLYECLTGAVPVEGTFAKLAVRLSAGPLPKVSELRSDVPPALSEIVARCLAPSPSDRFASALDVAKALRDSTTTAPEAIDLLRGGARPLATQQAGPGSESSTRRNHARAPFVTLASLQRTGEAPTTSRVEDVSHGGLLVFGKVAYQAGESLRLRFALPISGRVIAVASTVRWSRQARHGIATGLEFGALPEGAGEEIDRYVELMGRPG
jgi:serine/threonine protein kinase